MTVFQIMLYSGTFQVFEQFSTYGHKSILSINLQCSIFSIHCIRKDHSFDQSPCFKLWTEYQNRVNHRNHGGTRFQSNSLWDMRTHFLFSDSSCQGIPPFRIHALLLTEMNMITVLGGSFFITYMLKGVTPNPTSLKSSNSSISLLSPFFTSSVLRLISILVSLFPPVQPFNIFTLHL